MYVYFNIYSWKETKNKLVFDSSMNKNMSRELLVTNIL